MSMPERISTKFVRIRKPKQCFGCLMKFQIGAEMQHTTHVEEGRIWSIYACKTCAKLIDKHKVGVDEFEGNYQQGCVHSLMDELKRFKTPEELLEAIENKTL